MESWDDKILADKLNSLQDFPAGYSPNLSAKWEIVEASLPTGKKRRLIPLIIRWSVAAAVLVAIGLVWVNTDKKNTDSLAIKEQTQKPTVVFQPKQPTENEPFSTNPHPSYPSQPSHPNTNSKPKQAYQALPPTSTIPVRMDTNRGSNKDQNSSGNKDNEETAINPLSPTVDSISTKVLQQNTLATAIAEAPRPPKKKIYQRDFNDGVLAMDTGYAPASRQHFSIQLKPFARKTDGDETPTRRLQLKQAL